jgi:hypothetical protein
MGTLSPTKRPFPPTPTGGLLPNGADSLSFRQRDVSPAAALESAAREVVMRRVPSFPLVVPILACWLPAAARAQAPAEPSADPGAQVARLREELRSVRTEYEQRLAALEARLDALQQAPATEASPAAPLAEPPPPAVATPPSGPAPSSKVFNPDIAAIGDFLGAMGKSPGSGEPSLEMHEAEVSFQAFVDPYARGDVFLTFGPEEVGIEEAYATFPALPGGLLLKVGQMRDAFGKVDAMHNHTLPWTDRPLVTRNLTGGEEGLTDAGISLSRLVPVPGLFLEATGQVYRGQSEVFAAPTRGDLSYVGHLKAYRDLSESANLELGGSIAYGNNGVDASSTTRLIGVDASFRYRPLRRSIYTRFLARGEAVWSRRSELVGAPQSFGAYGFLEYQLARRWFAGLRFDYSDRAEDASLTDKGASALLTFWPSEFSQVRGQYRHARFGEGTTANEFLFQLIFSIGAHGAHPF